METRHYVQIFGAIIKKVAIFYFVWNKLSIRIQIVLKTKCTVKECYDTSHGLNKSLFGVVQNTREIIHQNSFVSNEQRYGIIIYQMSISMVKKQISTQDKKYTKVSDFLKASFELYSFELCAILSMQIV